MCCIFFLIPRIKKASYKHPAQGKKKDLSTREPNQITTDFITTLI